MPDPAPLTARAVARAELSRAILDAASAQLAEVGPAGLSLRAVARDLQMASSAVYRYFATRDVLLTALLVRAYDDLGATAEAADAGQPPDDLSGRLTAVAHAVRDWARAHPHEYALLYGSPVPGYVAPHDTVTPATRVTGVLLGVVADAVAAGVGPAPGTVAASSAEAEALAPISASVDPALPPTTTARALAVWATLIGQVSLELFGHLENAVLDHDVHFDHVVAQLVGDLGLAPHPTGGATS